MTLAKPAITIRSLPSQATAIAVAAAMVASHFVVSPAQAQGRRGGGPPIVRDAEIEQLLREYTQPILRAANLGQQNIQVVIVNSRSFNAFVADGRRIFVNAGAVM
jgi:predicted Zn-dependent protease